MLPKILFTAIAALAAIITIIFALMNTAAVSVVMPGTHIDLPLAVVAVKFYALGIISAVCGWKIRSKTLKVEAKQLEWQAQDAKLQAEIRSDREKQLEAKIATLEVALNAALKKKG
jgi:uncharacterized integral membrane protein